MSLSLQWTGHALVDAGLATLTSFAGKAAPSELEVEDLRTFGEYAEHAYSTPELTSFLVVLFTKNFLFVNGNPKIPADRRLSELRELLFGFEGSVDPLLPPCTYCGRSSVRLVHRDHLPMLTGRGTVNFFPNGDPGLAVCGYCLLAIQALSIGAPGVSGRAIIVDSEDKDLVLCLYREWQIQKRSRIALFESTKEVPHAIKKPLTRLIEALSQVDQDRGDMECPGLTAYLLYNGQDPTVDVYELPSITMGFLRHARAEKYRQAWNYLVGRSWQQGSKGKEDRPEARRNFLYEDLIVLLPSQPGRFLRRHILAHAVHWARRPEPEGAPPGFWTFTKLFASEFLNMDERQLERIRSLADALADSIASQNDRRLWQKVFQETNYARVRNLLITESRRRTGRGQTPLVSFDEFVDLFEVIEGYGRPGAMGWRLTWDLILIRIIDQLHAVGWLNAKPEEADEDLAGLEQRLSRDEEETEATSWRS